jgi:hypothetical protein
MAAMEVTLTILGRPLTFIRTAKVEACRRGIPKPGPCPDAKRFLSPPTRPKAVPRATTPTPKATPPVAPIKKAPMPPPPAAPTVQKTDYGSKKHLSAAFDALSALARHDSGWKFDPNTVKVTYPAGDAEVQLDQDGYHARIRRPNGSDYEQVHQDPAQAIADVVREHAANRA